MTGECLAPAADLEVYLGPLTGGRHTAVLFNRSPATANITLDLALLRTSSGGDVSVRDIVAHRTLGNFSRGDVVVVEVRSHAVAHLVLSQ
jgi:hypothetical protein